MNGYRVSFFGTNSKEFPSMYHDCAGGSNAFGVIFLAMRAKSHIAFMISTAEGHKL